jgi:hypothetical protein
MLRDELTCACHFNPTFVVVSAVARPAAAQWCSAAYLGTNHTPPSDVSIAVPALNLSLTYENVRFKRSRSSPPQINTEADSAG